MPGVPLALAPSSRSPGVGLLVDLKAGSTSPGTGAKRALLLGCINSSGSTITPDTQLVQAVAGESDVGLYAGVGGPTHLAAKRLFEELGSARVDLACAAAAASIAASATMTLAGSVTEARTVRSRVSGRITETVWASGESVTVAAARHVAAVNAKTDNMPVTAANVAGVITFTSKALGRIGNDITLAAQLIGGAGGTVAVSAAKLAGGTADPDWTNVLALVAGREYDYIGFVASNFDIAQTTGTAPARAKAHIDLYKSGLGAKLQQAMHGCTDSTNASLKTGVAAVNHDRSCYWLARDAESLPCEIMGWAIGQRLREIANNANTNRIGMTAIAALYGPADLVSGTPTVPEVEDDLNSGITCVSYDESGLAYVTRPITSYFKLGTGEADDRVLDDTRVDGCDFVAKDLRTFIATTFKGLNLIEVLADGEELPDNCVAIAEVRERVIGRMDVHIRLGIVRRDKFAKAVSDGSFIVRINPTDSTQVDYVVPTKIVSHLAKQSLAVLST